MPFSRRKQGENDDETLRGNDEWGMLLSGAAKVEAETIPSKRNCCEATLRASCDHKTMLRRTDEILFNLDTTKMCWIQAPEAVSEVVTRFFGETAVEPNTATPPAPDFERALRVLSTISHEPGVRDRDPRHPASFTALTAEEIEARSEAIRRVRAAEETWCATRGEKPEPWDAPSPTSSAEEEQAPRWS